MKVISLSRGKGKTSEIVKLSASKQIPIIYWLSAQKNLFYTRAEELGLSIPEPVQFDQAYDKEVLVDQIDAFMKFFLGVKVYGASADAEPVQIDKAEVAKKLGYASPEDIEIIG